MTDLYHKACHKCKACHYFSRGDFLYFEEKPDFIAGCLKTAFDANAQGACEKNRKDYAYY